MAGFEQSSENIKKIRESYNNFFFYFITILYMMELRTQFPLSHEYLQSIDFQGRDKFDQEFEQIIKRLES